MVTHITGLLLFNDKSVATITIHTQLLILLCNQSNFIAWNRKLGFHKTRSKNHKNWMITDFVYELVCVLTYFRSMWHVKHVDKLKTFLNAQSQSEEIYFVRKKEQNYKKCKFQEATIIVRVESESRSKTIVASSSDFSYTKCAGLSRRSVALSIYPGFPSTALYSGKKNLCRTRRMTRHVAT